MRRRIRFGTRQSRRPTKRMRTPRSCISSRRRTQDRLVEVHEEPHLVARPPPVLGGEGVDGEPAQTELERALDGVEQRLLPAAWPSVRFRPRACAQRPLPSITAATCSGMRDAIDAGRDHEVQTTAAAGNALGRAGRRGDEGASASSAGRWSTSSSRSSRRSGAIGGGTYGVVDRGDRVPVAVPACSCVAIAVAGFVSAGDDTFADDVVDALGLEGSAADAVLRRARGRREQPQRRDDRRLRRSALERARRSSARSAPRSTPPGRSRTRADRQGPRPRVARRRRPAVRVRRSR